MNIDLTPEITIRDSAVLTGAYVEGIILGAESSHPTKCHDYNQMILKVRFTIGSLTSASVKIEFSSDNSTYDQESSETNITGAVSIDPIVRTFDASGNHAIPIPISTRYIKVSAIGNGTVTDSLLGIAAVLAVN